MEEHQPTHLDNLIQPPVNYYNENDPKAAAWLRELIQQGHIAPGIVDERSIVDVQGNDLTEFCQCHFFAGIGGWSLALRLAGWLDDEPVWTGSCPCQPFSVAGKKQVDSDPRHLWPAFRTLIAERKPAIVFGEQVASKDGRIWLAGIRTDLEALGNDFGAADLCAAGVNSPQIRQRFFWLAHARSGGIPPRLSESKQREKGDAEIVIHSCNRTNPARLGDTESGGRRERRDASHAGNGRHVIGSSWSRFDLIPCRDGKSRRIESGTFPLAHGVPGRVGLLRGYGNAIVPQLAAEFIQAAIEAIQIVNS